MLEIVLGIGFFTAIIIALVVVILAAKSQLVASGTVSVLVNDEKTIEAPVGSKLLTFTGVRTTAPSATPGPAKKKAGTMARATPPSPRS